MQPKHYTYIDISCIFFCSIIFFTLGLRSQEIIGFDSRFYLFAKEMLTSGMSWFPTTYHEPYPDYLASTTILIYLVAHLFGGINKLVAILPSAIAASITLIVVYLIGALRARDVGLNAVFFMLLTITFFQSARSISLDLFITMITTICFYLIYSTHQHKFIYVLFLLGFAIRGPIGLVIPTGVVCTYYLLDRNFKQCVITGCISLSLLLLATCCLLFLAYQTGQEAFLKDVLRMQVLGRIDNQFFPYYFYFVNSLRNYALSFPLALLTIVGVIYYAFTAKVHSEDFNLLWKLIGWIAVILIGMSIPGDKKTRYILPMAPAISLLAAYLFTRSLQQPYFIFLRRILTPILFFFPLSMILALTFLNDYAHHYQLSSAIHDNNMVLVLSTLQLVNIVFFYYFRKQQETKILALASLSFIYCYLFMVEPIELYIDQSRDFVIQIEKKRLKDQAQLIFYKEKPDNLPIKYLINVHDSSTKPLFLFQPQELLNFSQKAYVVTSADYFSELSQDEKQKFRIVAKNKLGHVPVVVFVRTLKPSFPQKSVEERGRSR